MTMGLLPGMHRNLRKDSTKSVRHGTKRQVLKQYQHRMREIDAPDEARKVAMCPKCSAWFASVEDRNAHKAWTHGSRGLLHATVRVPVESDDPAAFRETAHTAAIANLRAFATEHGAVVDEETLIVSVGKEPFDSDGKQVYGDDIYVECVPDFPAPATEETSQ